MRIFTLYIYIYVICIQYLLEYVYELLIEYELYYVINIIQS